MSIPADDLGAGPHDVFLSYARVDGLETAQKLYTDLTQAGFGVWWDKSNQYGIPIGADFATEIQRGIRRSKVMVVLLTPGAVRDDGFVPNEIAYALAHNIRILPVMLLDCVAPLRIVQANWLDARTDYRFARDALIEALRSGQASGKLWRKSGSIHFPIPRITVGRHDFREMIFELVDKMSFAGVPDFEDALHLVVSKPRLGKTALMHRLRLDVAAAGGALALYVDLSAAGSGTTGVHDPIVAFINAMWAQLLEYSTDAQRFYQQIIPEFTTAKTLIYLKGALHATAAKRPILLLIDNLHLDEKKFLWEWTAQAHVGQRIIAVATVTDSAVSPVSKELRGRRKTLAPLQARDIAQAFDPPLEMDLAYRVFELCNGYPDQLESLLERWVEVKQVAFVGDKPRLLGEPEPPDLWDSDIEAAIDEAMTVLQLTDEQDDYTLTEWLTCAALQGSVFSELLLAAVMSEDVTPEQTAAWLDGFSALNPPILRPAESHLPIAGRFFEFDPAGLSVILTANAHPTDIAYYSARLIDAIERLMQPLSVRDLILTWAGRGIEALLAHHQAEATPPDAAQQAIEAHPITRHYRRYHGFADRGQKIAAQHLYIDLLTAQGAQPVQLWPLWRDLGRMLQGYAPNPVALTAFRRARRLAYQAKENRLELAYQTYLISVVCPYQHSLLQHAWQLLPEPLSALEPTSPQASEWIKDQSERYRAGRESLRDLLNTIAVILHALGVLARDTGRYDDARALLERALGIKETLGDAREIVLSLGALGVLARETRRYDEARALLERALGMLEALGDARGIALSLYELGVLARETGRYDEARALHERALGMQEALGNAREIASSLGALGLLARDEGKPKQARDVYEQALALLEQLGLAHEIAVVKASLQLLDQAEPSQTPADPSPDNPTD